MLQRRISPLGPVYYISPLLERAGVVHGFSTRVGGVSGGPFDSLNLGNPNGVPIQDHPENIAENYRLLQQAIGCRTQSRVWVHQVHAATVATAMRGQAFDTSTKADAIVSDDPERVLAIRVADCVPVLIASVDGKHVSAIHAGWRGVIAGAVPAAIRRLQFAGCEPASMLAAIGPCIGADAFEVGPEVVEEFEKAFGFAAPKSIGPKSPSLALTTGSNTTDFADSGLAATDADVNDSERSRLAPTDSAALSPDALAWRTPDGKGRVDLRRAIEHQLTASGIAPSRIDTTDRCTFLDSQEFFSHRREHGVTGRMAVLIAAR